MLNNNTKCKEIYTILNKKHIIQKSRTKYASKGLMFDYHMLERFYSLSFKYMKDPTFLATNSFLHMIH